MHDEPSDEIKIDQRKIDENDSDVGYDYTK